MWVLKTFILGLLSISQSGHIDFDVRPYLLVHKQLTVIHDNARARNTMGLKELLSVPDLYGDREKLGKDPDAEELSYVIDIVLSAPYVVTEAYYTTEREIEARVEITTNGLRATEKVVMTKNSRSWTGWIAKFPQRTINFHCITPNTYLKYFQWLERASSEFSQSSSEKCTDNFKFHQTTDEQMCENDEYMEEIILN